MPSVQPKRLLDLNLEDYMSYNEKLNYTPKPPTTWKKEKVQVIDRQINPATIKVTKEKIQDELELPETFTHLDVTTPAKGIFISDTPTVQDIINRNPEEFRRTEESTTIKKSPALKSAFAKQFELLKNMRKK
jgi:hypothetical protein